jgi:hypothetical protein
MKNNMHSNELLTEIKLLRIALEKADKARDSLLGYRIVGKINKLKAELYGERHFL